MKTLVEFFVFGKIENENKLVFSSVAFSKLNRAKACSILSIVKYNFLEKIVNVYYFLIWRNIEAL